MTAGGLVSTLVYMLVIGTLVSLACLAADGLCRQLRLESRWIWATGLAATVLLAARAIVLEQSASAAPSRVLQATAGATSAASPASHGVGVWLQAALDASAVLLRTAMLGIARLAAMVPAGLGNRADVVWLAISALALLVMAVVHVRVARMRRAWPTAQLHGVKVQIAPSIGPAVLGLVQPSIVVPRWLLARSANEQRLVLAHESEHVRARDHLLLAGAGVAAALVPWHPAVWVMLSRLRLAIELDCDARVLRHGVAPRVYGSLLIDLAGQCSGFTMGATALADESSHLERRLLAMTSSASRPSYLRAGALVAVSALSILAACEAKLPTSAEIQNMDVASAEKMATSAQLLDASAGASQTFYVDGVKTDAAIAHAIASERIATVDVKKVKGAAEIHITTLATARSRNAELSRTGGITSSRSSQKFEGLVFVDGVQSADKNVLSKLNRNDILNVEVIKGQKAAEQSSDPAAVNGIIRITTKAGAAK